MIFHNESKKTEFAIFRSFYDFLENLKIQQKLQRYLGLSFANRPLKRTQTLQLGP
jgi:hypothetical protein